MTENQSNVGLPDSEVEEIMQSVSKLAKDGGLSGIFTSLAGEKPTATETKAPTDRRIALLQALKPYLGEDRRAAIDKILQFAKLGSMLGNLLPK